MGPRARPVGFNHVAVEVVDEALEFYGRVFDFELRGPKMAFIEARDQFSSPSRESGRSRRTITATSASSRTTGRPSAGRRGRRAWRYTFRQEAGLSRPGGNRWQVVEYRDVQFTKAPGVLLGMDLEELEVRMWVDGPRRGPDAVDPAVRDLAREINLIVLKNEALQLGEKVEPRTPAASRLSQIQAPALVRVGDEDRPPASGRRRSARKRTARRAKDGHGRHGPPPNMKRPEEFNRLVLDFLTS